MPSTFMAHIYLVVFTALISLSFPIGSELTQTYDPLVITWVRYLMASLLFVGLLSVRGQFKLPGFKDVGRYTLICLPALLYFVAMFVALKDTSALDTSALYTTVPMISAIVAALVFKRRTDWRVMIALVIGMLGAGLIIFRGDLLAAGGISLTTSNQIYLLGCLAMACNPIVVKQLYRGEPLVYLTCWTLICATVLLTLVTFPLLVATDWMAIEGQSWLAMSYLAVFATAISFFLFQQGSVVLPPEQVSAYTYLIPVLVLVINQFGGDNVPLGDVALGVFLVMFSMMIMTGLSLRRKRIKL